MAQTYTYSDECPKCGGEARTFEYRDDRQDRIECQEPGCFHTEHI